MNHKSKILIAWSRLQPRGRAWRVALEVALEDVEIRRLELVDVPMGLGNCRVRAMREGVKLASEHQLA